MQSRVQTEQANIANETEAQGGPSGDPRKKLEEFLKFATLVVALGPSTALKRNNDSDYREFPDDVDFGYYKDLSSILGFDGFFLSERWGAARVSIESADVNGHNVLALRVKWENRVSLVQDSHAPETFVQLVNAVLSKIHGLMSPKWLEWRLDLG